MKIVLFIMPFEVYRLCILSAETAIYFIAYYSYRSNAFCKNNEVAIPTEGQITIWYDVGRITRQKIPAGPTLLNFSVKTCQFAQ